jgi:site-specific DNA recombinase
MGMFDETSLQAAYFCSAINAAHAAFTGLFSLRRVHLGRSHLYNLLSNVLYTGRFLVDGALYPGEHDAIVDQETFDLVQARLQLNSRDRDSASRRKTEALLRGLIYCSTCGSAMYPTYSSSGERRYRYYVCLRAQQRNETHCLTRAVSAPAIEGAVLETVRSIGVHPRVLEGTIRAARREVAQQIGLLEDELRAVQVRVKNFKSQLARMRQLDPARQASLSEQIAAGQAHATDLKQQIQRRELRSLGENELRQVMKSFDVLWKTMNIEEQCLLLRQVLEKVGYDSRSGKVIVSFRSASARELCQDTTN